MARAFKSEYYELPSKYDKTAVKLLVQSPTRMYAYWDVSDDTIKHFLGDNYDDCIPFLKITNLTLGYSNEIKIDPFSNNYYIEVKDSDCDYKVELIRKGVHAVHLITASNSAHIPRSSPLDYNEDIVFRNCICLSITDRFKVYKHQREQLKDYAELPFNDFYDNISSMTSSMK